MRDGRMRREGTDERGVQFLVTDKILCGCLSFSCPLCRRALQLEESHQHLSVSFGCTRSTLQQGIVTTCFAPHIPASHIKYFHLVFRVELENSHRLANPLNNQYDQSDPIQSNPIQSIHSFLNQNHVHPQVSPHCCLQVPLQ
jgi:hypothetical protein